MENAIYFWLNKGDNAYLSQWYNSEFEVDGLVYKNAEQYMMAQKAKCFKDEEVFGEILRTIDPKEIKALGRKVKGFNDTEWDRLKRGIVLKGNIAKFSQSEKLKGKLLATDDALLVEASPYDSVWGIGLKEDNPLAWDKDTWKGQNLLGYILMDVREQMKVD